MKRYKVTHIMADGTELGSVEGITIPAEMDGFYRYMANSIEEKVKKNR